MAKQTELFENEGYIMGFSPRDKAIREARELEEAKKRASTYQNEPQTGRNSRRYSWPVARKRAGSTLVSAFVEWA